MPFTDTGGSVSDLCARYQGFDSGRVRINFFFLFRGCYSPLHKRHLKRRSIAAIKVIYLLQENISLVFLKSEKQKYRLGLLSNIHF